MKIIFLTLSAIITMRFAAVGQRTPIVLLENMIKAINSNGVISYNIKSVDKNAFSQNDTTRIQSRETIRFNSNGNIISEERITNINDYQTYLREVYSRDTLYAINLKDSSYTLNAHPKSVYNAMTSLIENIRYSIDKKSSAITFLKDTVIDNIDCYNIFINQYDAMENGNHNYTYRFLCINKKTFLPMYSKGVGEGSAEKDGYSLGRLHLFNETYYYAYHYLSAGLRRFEFDKSGFGIKSNTMLAVGATAPAISARDLSNKEISASFFKNKILLVEFGATSCGANSLANPMLNRLSKKYKDSGVLIFGLYPDETNKQLNDYTKANNLEFRIYLDDHKLERLFQTTGTPNFYLIDKNGKIIQSIGGYNDLLEQQLTDGIEKLLEKANSF